MYSQGIRCAELAFLWSGTQMASVAATAERHTTCPRLLLERFGVSSSLCGSYRTSTYLFALLFRSACGTGTARCTHQVGRHVHRRAGITGPQS